MTTYDTNADCTHQAAFARSSLWQRLFRFRALRRQRLSLSQLDDHMLRDVGLTTAQAHKEAARKPWDVPTNWVE